MSDTPLCMRCHQPYGDNERGFDVFCDACAEDIDCAALDMIVEALGEIIDARTFDAPEQRRAA